MRLRELAEARPRFGYQRLHVLLRREGWPINRKRVYRLYREEGLVVRTKRRCKRASHVRVVLPEATTADDRWSMDFVSDQLDNGRRFRALTVVDQYTRECVAIEAGFSMTSRKVATVLQRFSAARGRPRAITVDNGPEFYGKDLDSWAYRNDVRLDFIRPGKPVENAYIESFNGRLRDECLNGEIFFSIEDAQQKLDAWRLDYNRSRPHGSLGNMTPEEFARINRSIEAPEAEIVKLGVA